MTKNNSETHSSQTLFVLQYVRSSYLVYSTEFQFNHEFSDISNYAPLFSESIHPSKASLRVKRRHGPQSCRVAAQERQKYFLHTHVMKLFISSHPYYTALLKVLRLSQAAIAQPHFTVYLSRCIGRVLCSLHCSSHCAVHHLQARTRRRPKDAGLLLQPHWPRCNRPHHRQSSCGVASHLSSTPM